MCSWIPHESRVHKRGWAGRWMADVHSGVVWKSVQKNINTETGGEWLTGLCRLVGQFGKGLTEEGRILCGDLGRSRPHMASLPGWPPACGTWRAALSEASGTLQAMWCHPSPDLPPCSTSQSARVRPNFQSTFVSIKTSSKDHPAPTNVYQNTTA